MLPTIANGRGLLNRKSVCVCGGGGGGGGRGGGGLLSSGFMLNAASGKTLRDLVVCMMCKHNLKYV